MRKSMLALLGAVCLSAAPALAGEKFVLIDHTDGTDPFWPVVLNGAPARRDDAESPIVTIAREALAKFRAPAWGGQITNRADLLMALGQGEGVREYYAEGRAAAEIARLWAAVERSVKAIRGTASPSGAMHKQAA